jgi:hypothetical protein
MLSVRFEGLIVSPAGVQEGVSEEELGSSVAANRYEELPRWLRTVGEHTSSGLFRLRGNMFYPGPRQSSIRSRN